MNHQSNHGDAALASTAIGGEKQQDEPVSTNDMQKLNNEMREHDETREAVIKRSRDVVKNAKSSIYCLHRDQFDKAESLMQEAESAVSELHAHYIQANPWLRQGIFSDGVEELVEARIFQHFLTHGTVPPSTNFSLCDREEYAHFKMQYSGIWSNCILASLLCFSPAQVHRWSA